MRFINSELVTTYDSEPIVVGDAAFNFRIEIHKKLTEATYFAKMFRMDFYRIQPTFPQVQGEPSVDGADEQFYVLDAFFDENELSARSVEACLAKVVQKLTKTFPDACVDSEDDPDEQQ